VRLPREGRGWFPGVPRRRKETSSRDFWVAGSGVTHSALEAGLLFSYVWPESSFAIILMSLKMNFKRKYVEALDVFQSLGKTSRFPFLQNNRDSKSTITS